MRTITMRHIPMLPYLTSTRMQAAAFSLEFIVPCFQILDLYGKEGGCGIFSTKLTFDKTKSDLFSHIYFLFFFLIS